MSPACQMCLCPSEIFFLLRYSSLINSQLFISSIKCWASLRRQVLMVIIIFGSDSCSELGKHQFWRQFLQSWSTCSSGISFFSSKQKSFNILWRKTHFHFSEKECNNLILQALPNGVKLLKASMILALLLEKISKFPERDDKEVSEKYENFTEATLSVTCTGQINQPHQQSKHSLCRQTEVKITGSQWSKT